MSGEQRCVKCAGPSGGLPYCPTCDPANPDTPTAPERGWEIHEPPPFCVRCDGYGVVLPVGSSIVVTCPACNGKTADRPERGPKAAPAAAPPVDTALLRREAQAWIDNFGDDAFGLGLAADELDALREAGKVVVADADAAWAEVARQRTELDTHRARRAELVALVAEWRASGEAATENPGLRAVMLARADELARILGEQP